MAPAQPQRLVEKRAVLGHPAIVGIRERDREVLFPVDPPLERGLHQPHLPERSRRRRKGVCLAEHFEGLLWLAVPAEAEPLFDQSVRARLGGHGTDRQRGRPKKSSDEQGTLHGVSQFEGMPMPFLSRPVSFGGWSARAHESVERSASFFCAFGPWSGRRCGLVRFLGLRGCSRDGCLGGRLWNRRSIWCDWQRRRRQGLRDRCDWRCLRGHELRDRIAGRSRNRRAGVEAPRRFRDAGTRSRAPRR